ncbi:hypothetical protein ANN_03619 [Periplaneta americana]|uniref:Uncharacterized protein n=1 Tax=Periplaneta americana TaxID=6978 RepID=A0ABQ8U2J0_PERAM|nr:hypothetical protein ANN_03619 [Periplaneta americana]
MTGLCEGGNEPPGSLKASALTSLVQDIMPELYGPSQCSVVLDTLLVAILRAVYRFKIYREPRTLKYDKMFRAVSIWKKAETLPRSDRSTGGSPKLLALSTGLRGLYSYDDG